MYGSLQRIKINNIEKVLDIQILGRDLWISKIETNPLIKYMKQNNNKLNQHQK